MRYYFSIAEMENKSNISKITGNELYDQASVEAAPADGVILKIAESSHAVSLRCDSGVDLLIHVGMDTVERHGAGFAPQVRAGEHVHSGQLLLKFDLQKIRADGYPLTTPVVVTNSDAFSDVTVVASGNVTEGQNILLLR